MICPKCKHPTRHHGGERGMGCWDVETESPCSCPLTEAQATLAAQRHAAAAYLWEHRVWAYPCGGCNENYIVNGYKQAIRDCGIQRPLRSEAK